MIIRTATGVPCRYCVLIPSCGRSDVLERNLLQKMPFLLQQGLYVATHAGDTAYVEVQRAVRRAGGRSVTVANPTGSVAVMRERLRTLAVTDGYDQYVVTDDNAVYTEESLTNLVRAAAEYPAHPCTMAGFHNTAVHFDRHRIACGVQTVHGLRSYAHITMMFQTYPHDLYAIYRYPPDAYGYDDRHFYLWAIQQGVKHFRVCMDAPFSKARYDGTGGQGTVEQRALKNGLATVRLATDFPHYIGASGTLRVAWQTILNLAAGRVPDRLVGGAMRKEADLIRPSSTTSVTVRRQPRSK